MDQDVKKSNREMNGEVLKIYKEFLSKIRNIEAERDRQIAEIYRQADSKEADKILRSIKKE